jgi:hypothetical protein
MDGRTSLLWPPTYRAGEATCGAELDAGCARDIGLGARVDALAPEAADRPAVELAPADDRVCYIRES